jgi:hypothetical protein
MYDIAETPAAMRWYRELVPSLPEDPANADRISQWAKDYWAELHPTSAGGAYVKFLLEEGQHRIRAFPGGKVCPGIRPLVT